MKIRCYGNLYIFQLFGWMMPIRNFLLLLLAGCPTQSKTMKNASYYLYLRCCPLLLQLYMNLRWSRLLYSLWNVWFIHIPSVFGGSCNMAEKVTWWLSLVLINQIKCTCKFVTHGSVLEYVVKDCNYLYKHIFH